MRLLVTLVVLALGVVAADRVGEQVAEGLVADRLAPRLVGQPEVEVEGVPFLTQVLAGRYDRVRVEAAGVRGLDLALTDLRGTISGLQLPLSDAVAGRIGEVPVDRLQAQALVPWSELEAAVADRGVALSAAGPQLRVAGQVRVRGGEVGAVSLSDVRVEDGAVVVRASRFEVDGAPPADALARTLRDRFDLRVPVGDLPYGLALTDLRVERDGLAVTTSASDVVLE